jgi:uncharacterized protein YkwD
MSGWRHVVAALAAAVTAGCVLSPPAEEPAPADYSGPPGAYGAEGDPVEPGVDDGAGEPSDFDEPPEPSDLEPGPNESVPEGDPADEAPISAAAPPVAEPPGPAASSPDRGPSIEPVAAKRPAGVSAFEADVAAAASRFRRDPRWLAGALGRYRQYYRGRQIHLPGLDAAILTQEGVAAVDEAIAAARRAKRRPRLRLSAGLSRAAREHARELGRLGTLDHSGRDGSQPPERMARHGRVVGPSGENIGTGWGDAEIMVLGLFVDDGVRGRGHRVNLLEPAYRVIGVGCAPHRQYGTVCVLDLAGELRE